MERSKIIFFSCLLLLIGHTVGTKQDNNTDCEEEDTVYRPCSIDDSKCIQDYLVSKEVCTPTQEPPSDPYKFPVIAVEIPHANVSLRATNATLTGYRDGCIGDFFVNKKTNRLILEVKFPAIIINTTVTEATYYSKAKEPINTSDVLSITFRELSFTLIYCDGQSYIYAYLGDSCPVMLLGPGLRKEVQGTNLIWRDMIGLSTQEAMLQQGPLYFNAYLNNWICNVRE